MTNKIKPRYAVRYKLAGHGTDKGFAYFNSKDDAILFRDTLNAEALAADDAPFYEAIDLRTMDVLTDPAPTN